MTPEHWQRCKALFDQLVDLPEQEREEELRKLPSDVQDDVRGLILADEAPPLDYRPPVDAGSLLGKHAFEPGLVLSNRFRIDRFLGAGGMGEVYAAYDLRSRRSVAIKTILPALALDPAVRERFEREAARALTVTHRNVCRIYASDRILKGGIEQPFFTMELLQGETLHARLERDGRLPEAEAQRIALDICAGVAEAHRSGVIHRDLKPLNIMLVEEGGERAVVMDFGVAKKTAGNETLLTREQAPRTDIYAAPELLDGEPATARSDIYALGLILYEMVTGKRPFESENDTAAVLMRMTRRAPSPAKHVPGLPRRWVIAIQSCLERDPRLRIGSAEGVAEIITGANLLLTAARFGFERRRIFAAGAVAGLAAVVGYQFWIVKPPYASRPLILLAAGIASPAQKELAQFVHNLLGIALEQSRYVRRVPAATVGYYRARLDSEDEEEILETIAREQKASAVVRDTVERTGSGYLISLSVEPLDGGPRMNLQQQARGLTDLAAAVDRLGSALRTTLGEPDDLIRANRVLLEKATTTSAPAMELYSQALSAFDSGDQESALARWSEAARVDPDFAMAYMQQALVHSAMRREAQGLNAIEVAMRLRDRMSARQQQEVEALYDVLTYNYHEALRIYHQLAAIYPSDAQIHRRLAHLLGIAAQPEKALEQARLAVDLDPHNINNHTVLSSSLAMANRPDAALEAVARARKEGLDAALLRSSEGVALMLRGDFRAARATFQKYAQARGFESTGSGYATRCLVFEGRLEDACEEFEAGLAVDIAQHDEANEYLRRAWLGQLYAAMGLTTEARAHAQALAGAPALPSGLFALRAAVLVAFSTRTPQIAARALARLKHVNERYPGAFSESLLKQAQGVTSHLEGRMTSAGPSLRNAHALWPDIAAAWCWGEHNLRLGHYDDALRSFSQALAGKGIAFRWDHGIFWILSLERAARCRLALRDWKRAVAQFDEFFRYWGTQDAAPLADEARRLRAKAIKQEVI